MEEVKGNGPNVYWPKEDVELCTKILDRVIKEYEVCNPEHEEAVERKGLSKRLSGKEVPKASGVPGNSLSGEVHDADASPTSELHSVEQEGVQKPLQQ